tara:strand:+ start:3709 stop:4185 length:477 start_codon:yes stop_codon:yes gene_type:complete
MRVAEEKSVQEIHASNSICYGCGPANKDGLQIKSFRIENGLKMEFLPSEEHQAFPGMINGGIIGTLLDCHGNWTAAMALMDKEEMNSPPCTVTASYSVKLKRPTPLGEVLIITSEIGGIENNTVEVNLKLEAAGNICATGKGLFVAVKEGHPAFHRWS